jgi:type IX secretion system PorP/SprF family membrane protein
MNLTRHIFTFTIGLILSSNSIAQQEPRSSFFWNQYMYTNPAMTGAIYKHHANAQWRNQWTKINGAPTTLWLNYAARIDKINSGIGASYEYDVIGLNKQHTALASYAYHIPIKKIFLSLGISAGFSSLSFDTKGYIYFDVNNQPLPQSQSFFRGDLGIALHGEKWNAGLSCTKLNGYFTRSSGPYDIAPHYWLFGDYTFQLGENWTLTPRAQVGSDLLNIYSIAALTASWKNLWFGVTVANPFGGSGFELGPMIGYDIVGKFRVGYTYEFGVNSHFSNAIKNNGTHEIILSYQLK